MDYLSRVFRYTQLCPSLLLATLIYTDRLCSLVPAFSLSSLTVHRFLIAALTVASKSLSDLYCTNAFLARVGGISTRELNLLEVELCLRMDWQLVVSQERLEEYYTNLASWKTESPNASLSQPVPSTLVPNDPTTTSTTTNQTDSTTDHASDTERRSLA